jgi:hypothetical protein
MKSIRAALLSAAATCLAPFATPAIAELGHPSGCASCAPVEVTGPTPGYDHEGGSVIGPLLSIGVPPKATALAPDTGHRRRPLANGCHVKVSDATDPRERHIVYRQDRAESRRAPSSESLRSTLARAGCCIRADDWMAAIAAERIVRHFELARFIVIRRPWISGSSPTRA